MERRAGGGRKAERAAASLTMLAALALLLGPAGCSGGGDEASRTDRQATAQAGQAGETGEMAAGQQASGGGNMVGGETSGRDGAGAAGLVLTSAAFGSLETVPTIHTCEGDDSSPPLAWQGAPDGTRAYALVVDDPDAPRGTWDHWVLYDIPAATTSLATGAGAEERPGGGVPGRNGWGKTVYGGPCPPPGKPHRYFFKLYALSEPTELAPGAGKAELLEALKGRVLAKAELVGMYQR